MTLTPRGKAIALKLLKDVWTINSDKAFLYKILRNKNHSMKDMERLEEIYRLSKPRKY
jgi:hypothetical protein